MGKEGFADCEWCGKYCGDEELKCRLLVELPEELKKEIEKDRAWLCLSCVKRFCKETLGKPLIDQFGRPILDKNGVQVRDSYWYKLLFKEENRYSF